MAKMFYTLDEAAEQLGIGPDDVRELASQGKLQQFRDRDKLMFKREQVDALNAENQAGDDTGQAMALADSSDTDQIDLAKEPSKPRKEDPRQATGVSVFDQGEVEPADPAAQTQVTQPAIEDEELALESVGSGSGLLDLTRESDDTSLGAELLEEIYPSGESSDANLESGEASSAMFDTGLDMEASGASGLENMQGNAPMTSAGAAGMASVGPAEPDDPAGSGLGFGVLAVATAALVIIGIVMISMIQGVPSGLVSTIAADSSSLMMYTGILFGATLVLGVVGFVVGRLFAR